MNTYQKGNLSEAVLTAKLLEAGYIVLIPVGGGHRYDLIIDTPEGFKRIQVKTAKIRGQKIVFNVCSNNKGYKRKAYHGEIDFFGVYCTEFKECYLVPIDDVGVSEKALRIGESKKANSRVRMKNDFLIKSL